MDSRAKFHGRQVMIEELMKCTLEDYFERRKSIFTGNTYRAPQHLVLASVLAGATCCFLLPGGRAWNELSHVRPAGDHVVS